MWKGRRVELLEAERAAARLEAEITAYHRRMLEEFGPLAASPFSLEEQKERPGLFWRLRLNQLYGLHGEEWVDENIHGSEAGRMRDVAEAELQSLWSRLFDLRRAAGLEHGESLDPESGHIVRSRRRARKA